jgi:MoaA/NifB/PqqE/SkfB family radical SAM enzyme
MGSDKKPRLSLPEIQKLVEEIIALGAIQINLTGGEPLMAHDIFEIIRLLKPHKTIITLNTNGLLLNEEMIDKLEKAGVDIIKISIDSPIAEEHDASRGVQGCFQTVIKALEYIQKKQKLISQISTVCIKENLNSDRIWKLVEMAERYGALLGLTIPAASGKWMGDESVLLGDREKGVLKKLVKIPHVIRDTDEAYMKSGCPAGSEEFYVTCYGDVIPCPLIQISFGNVRERSLKETWEKMDSFEGFKKGHVGCLSGENEFFIKNFILPIKNEREFPIPIEKHPRSKETK